MTDQATDTLRAAEHERERMRQEIIDDLDEEIELELQEDGLDGSISESENAFRREYFRELVRLQTELVKLQDWVQATGQRIVVLFEGRDAAGKGGVIKRITQRLNPASAAWPPCPPQQTVKKRSGISSAMWRTYLPRVRSCCLTVAGITAPVWNT